MIKFFGDIFFEISSQCVDYLRDVRESNTYNRKKLCTQRVLIMNDFFGCEANITMFKYRWETKMASSPYRT